MLLVDYMFSGCAKSVTVVQTTTGNQSASEMVVLLAPAFLLQAPKQSKKIFGKSILLFYPHRSSCVNIRPIVEID